MNTVNLSGKNILVTGADGFIGSHLCESLLKAGAKVRGLSCYNSFGSWGWLEDVDRKDEIEIVSGDVRDPHFCELILEDQEIVFNLAALIAIPYSYKAPDSYIETNVKGALNICQAAKNCGGSKVIQMSSSEVYGTAIYVPIDEKHPLQPQSPYSATKIGADSIALSFFHAYQLPVVIARPFNTYGPRQSARAVIPSIIVQIASGMKKLRLGDTTTTRDFNFVEDTCNGLLSLASCEGAIGEVVNIGSNTEISIFETFKMISCLMDAEVEIETDDERLRPAGSEVRRLRCDNTKLRTLTGFVSSYSLESGLTRTIDWFTKPNNLSKYKAGIYNV
jgi:NAD dependent epimerase/dehydratase